MAQFEGQSKRRGLALKEEVRIDRTADRRMLRRAPAASPVAPGAALAAVVVVPAQPAEAVAAWLPAGPAAWAWAPGAFWPAWDRRRKHARIANT
ncbi:MAG: hypothetical protein ACLQU2_01130 [Candidatus Binataceae bacterium]